MRVAITGSSGFIGHALVRELSERHGAHQLTLLASSPAAWEQLGATWPQHKVLLLHRKDGHIERSTVERMDIVRLKAVTDDVAKIQAQRKPVVL